MGMQRVTLRLTELRCIAQSEGSDGSEPYLWTTYFVFGAPQLPFQTGLFGIVTPTYDAFRTEFRDGMKAGQVANVPTFIASASFDMDLDSAPQPKMVGCIAVLMEEDSTPHSSIVLGRIAYTKEIEKQLDALAKKRFLANDFGDVTDAEKATILTNVKSKVATAIGSNQSIFNAFTNQDDNIGFSFKVFTHLASAPANSEIKFQSFDFPEIGKGADRFVLSGQLFLGPISPNPVDRCAPQRAALKAKQDEIKALQNQVLSLQGSLSGATPQQKAGIVRSIRDANEMISRAQAQLPTLQAALDTCMNRLPGTHGGQAGGTMTGGTSRTVG